jgi:hypothetical protein
MDIKLIGNGDRTGTGEKDQKKNAKTEESYRIAVTKKVDEEISEMIVKVNDGFNAGKVNRPQLVNWILSKFYSSFGEVEIKAIRADHFDEISMLDSILRQAKETGKVPNEFRALLQKHMGLDDAPKKSKPKIDKDFHQ